MTRSDWHLEEHLGGWVLSSDTMTLIVAETPRGELLLLDVTGEKDPRRVTVDFKPTALAVQGNTLYAAAEGSGFVHALKLPDFKQVREFRIPGGAVQRLACHPSKGMVYAVLSDNKIAVLDPNGGTATLTTARGQNVAVDPQDPTNLYASINFSSREVADFLAIGDNRLRLELKRVTPTAVLFKYHAEGKSLRLVRGIANASIGHRGELAISPEGNAITLVSPGGWWDTENNSRLHDIAFFQTSDMKTVLAGLSLGDPRAAVFHPVLDLLAAQGGGGRITLFKRKSQIERAKFYLPNLSPHYLNPRMRNPVEVLTFAGKGTRLAVINVETIHFVELELTDEERATLKTKYGELPISRLTNSKTIVETALDKPINLLDGLDLHQSAIWSEWTRVEGKIQAPADGRLYLKTGLLPKEYIVTLTAERVEDKGAISISLPVNPGRMLVAADFAYQQAAGGLGFLDTRNAFDTNGANWNRQLFPRGKPVTLTATIRKTGVTIVADNKKILDWKGDPTKFHPAPAPNEQYHNQYERWFFPDRPGLFLYATGPFRVSQLEVGPVPNVVAQETTEPEKTTPPPVVASNPPILNPNISRITPKVMPEKSSTTKPAAWSHLKHSHFTEKDGYLINKVDHHSARPDESISTKEFYSGPLQIKAIARLP